MLIGDLMFRGGGLPRRLTRSPSASSGMVPAQAKGDGPRRCRSAARSPNRRPKRWPRRRWPNRR
jgi:hypothetical protein